MSLFRGRAADEQCDVLLIGGYPPPYGGVNVHVQRLAAVLQRTVDVRVVDYFREIEPGWDPDTPFVYRVGPVHQRRLRALRILSRLARTQCSVLHFHAGSFDRFAMLALPMLWASSRTARRAVTIHSGTFPIRVQSASALRKRWLGSVLAKFDLVICVSEEIQATVKALDPGAHTMVLPAFLPPSIEAQSPVAAEVEVLRNDGRTVLLVSGFAQPHYGFHVVLDALLARPELAKSVALVFTFYNTYDADYHRVLLTRLAESGVPFKVYDNLKPDRFAALLKASDLYVRPTDRDGDSVAIREARALGTPVLASDCVRRPEGTLLFETMNADALAAALRQALDQPSHHQGLEEPNTNVSGVRQAYAHLGLTV